MTASLAILDLGQGTVIINSGRSNCLSIFGSAILFTALGIMLSGTGLPKAAHTISFMAC